MRESQREVQQYSCSAYDVLKFFQNKTFRMAQKFWKSQNHRGRRQLAGRRPVLLHKNTGLDAEVFGTGKTTPWVPPMFLQFLPADCGLARSELTTAPQVVERRIIWWRSLRGLGELGWGVFRRPF